LKRGWNDNRSQGVAEKKKKKGGKNLVSRSRER